MDKSYTKYIEIFKLGFDSIPEIEGNLYLQQTLNVIIYHLLHVTYYIIEINII